MTPADDRDLIQRILKGDGNASDALVQRLYPSVQRAVAPILRRTPDAVFDVTQRAFMKLYENDMRALRAFRGEDFGPYLRKIAKRVALEHLRMEGRGPHQVTLSGPDDTLDPDAGPPVDVPDNLRPDPEVQTIEADLVARRRALVRHAMEHRLSQREREVITMIYFEELDRAEAARVLGVTSNNLDQIAYRARRKLADELDKCRDDPALQLE